MYIQYIIVILLSDPEVMTTVLTSCSFTNKNWFSFNVLQRWATRTTEFTFCSFRKTTLATQLRDDLLRSAQDAPPNAHSALLMGDVPSEDYSNTTNFKCSFYTVGAVNEEIRASGSAQTHKSAALAEVCTKSADYCRQMSSPTSVSLILSGGKLFCVRMHTFRLASGLGVCPSP